MAYHLYTFQRLMNSSSIFSNTIAYFRIKIHQTLHYGTIWTPHGSNKTNILRYDSTHRGLKQGSIAKHAQWWAWYMQHSYNDDDLRKSIRGLLGNSSGNVRRDSIWENTMLHFLVKRCLINHGVALCTIALSPWILKIHVLMAKGNQLCTVHLRPKKILKLYF